MQNCNIKNILKKKNAEYQRTSSGGQDLKLQSETNAEFLKSIPEEDRLTFVDFDVSATKLSMDERPALTRMLKMIENGVISRVVVYERDRLARNVYEYISIVKKFYEHEVEVIFTATDAPPFSKDIFLETWYGLSAQFEGKRITTRLADARKRNPSSIIGYIKQNVTTESGTNQKIYKADPKIKNDLYKLFYHFSNVKNLEQINNVIMQFQSVLKRTELRIIDILNNPFFAAHFEGTDGLYHQLPNVEQIISLELFKKVQERITEFEDGLQQGLSYSKKVASITPSCGKCKNELKFKKGNIGQSGTYVCSKHRKYAISFSELNEKIIQSVKQALSQLSTNSLEKITLKVINNQITILNKKSDELFFELEKLCIKFSNIFKPTDEYKQMKRLHEQIIEVREQLSIIQSNISSLQLLKDEVLLIIERVESGLQHLNEKDYLDLAELLIASIEVQEDYVLFQYYFSDFFIDTGDESYAANS